VGAFASKTPLLQLKGNVDGGSAPVPPGHSGKCNWRPNSTPVVAPVFHGPVKENQNNNTNDIKEHILDFQEYKVIMQTDSK